MKKKTRRAEIWYSSPSNSNSNSNHQERGKKKKDLKWNSDGETIFENNDHRVAYFFNLRGCLGRDSNRSNASCRRATRSMSRLPRSFLRVRSGILVAPDIPTTTTGGRSEERLVFVIQQIVQRGDLVTLMLERVHDFLQMLREDVAFCWTRSGVHQLILIGQLDVDRFIMCEIIFELSDNARKHSLRRQPLLLVLSLSLGDIPILLLSSGLSIPGTRPPLARSTLRPGGPLRFPRTMTVTRKRISSSRTCSRCRFPLRLMLIPAAHRTRPLIVFWRRKEQALEVFTPDSRERCRVRCRRRVMSGEMPGCVCSVGGWTGRC